MAVAKGTLEFEINTWERYFWALRSNVAKKLSPDFNLRGKSKRWGELG